jgi:hypothetical protein
MKRVKADESVLLKDVGLLLEPVEIYDATGKLLGLFVPANLERGMQMEQQAQTEIDWEEIEREWRTPEQCYPFEAVRQRLGLLAKEVERRQAAGEGELTEEEAVAFLDRLRQQAGGSGAEKA